MDEQKFRTIFPSHPQPSPGHGPPPIESKPGDIDRAVKRQLAFPPMNRRLTQRGRERRQQLMDFAATRFAEQGYHPTSVAEIVQGLGVGKGVFYWYFSSKEELFFEILREAQQDLRRSQQQAIDGVDDPVRRIELGLQASMRWSSEHQELFNLFAFAATEERFAPALRKGQEIAVADAMRHVQDGMDRGEIRVGDPELYAHAILGVSSQLARRFVHERGDAWPDVADAAVAFCLEGLLVPVRHRSRVTGSDGASHGRARPRDLHVRHRLRRARQQHHLHPLAGDRPAAAADRHRHPDARPAGAGRGAGADPHRDRLPQPARARRSRCTCRCGSPSCGPRRPRSSSPSPAASAWPPPRCSAACSSTPANGRPSRLTPRRPGPPAAVRRTLLSEDVGSARRSARPALRPRACRAPGGGCGWPGWCAARSR